MVIDEHPRRLIRFSIFVLLLSLIFYLWAVANVWYYDFDFGLVSFFGTSLTSCYLLALGNVNRVPESNATKIAVTVSHMVAAFSYILGAYAYLVQLHHIGLGLYCVFFATLWILIAYRGHRLLVSNPEATPVESAGEEPAPLESQGGATIV